jgi:hypothetical protein
MDILEQYEKQNPQPVQTASQRQPAYEYGFFIRLVMRLSGGKIENTRQASYVLLAVVGAILLAAVLVLFGALGFSSTAKPQYSTDPARLPPALRQQPQN